MTEKELLKIELYCPNCKKKIKVKRYNIDLEWNWFRIQKNCEHCNYKIKYGYNTDEIEELINKR